MPVTIYTPTEAKKRRSREGIVVSGLLQAERRYSQNRKNPGER
jgi:hypothetical protein